MAFSLRNLSVLAYANGFTLWHYKSETDSIDRTTSRGYFAPASDLLAGGDMVMISGADAGKLGVFSGAGNTIAVTPL
jgi:hypothetical protein